MVSPRSYSLELQFLKFVVEMRGMIWPLLNINMAHLFQWEKIKLVVTSIEINVIWMYIDCMTVMILFWWFEVLLACLHIICCWLCLLPKKEIWLSIWNVLFAAFVCCVKSMQNVA